MLEALAKGKVKFSTLSEQVIVLLNKAPQSAEKILAQLDEFYQQQKIDEQHYLELKRQINEFSRAHANGNEAGDTDSTQILGSDDDADSTVVNTETAAGAVDFDISSAAADEAMDSTQILGSDDGDSTVVSTETAAGAVDFDISSAAADATNPSLTSSTATGWVDPTATTDDLSGNYGAGSIIKHRFKLEKVLGIGGMGKVYKAIDLLKQEAQDKKPHVAIKLLNDDFKDHPEAFISLQRESSRQQKLAHPNIATIYDFDRVGGPNTPVYITMELMEGMELKDYIKKEARPTDGVPFEKAYDIIQQLGAGLIYAHDRGLVHSDFKPGNAFYCNDGIVKTLDFGIARAVTNPITGEAEKTLFDPGKLGALTPAYASLEMLEGKEPDTRDDTYALGCTSYELLTGKHPFNKLPANKAMENGLVPPYIKTLNKKQNRALRSSVAFHRADRSPSVNHFVEELAGKATWHKNPFVIAAAVLLLIALMLIAPAIEYLHDQKLEKMVAQINSGNEQTIVAKLQEILELEKTDQVTVRNKSKEVIQNYFRDKIAGLINTAEDDYDFPGADDAIKEIHQFYPESIFLQEQKQIVSSSRKRIISSLNEQYIAALKSPELIDNTKDILDKISHIDPEHPLLTDPRPSNAYRLLALDKFNANEFDAALELIYSGLATAEDDPRLSDLETKILRAQEIAQLESDLSAVQLVTLSDYKEKEAMIVELANLKSNSTVVISLADTFQTISQKEIDTILKSGSRSDAEAFADEFGDLMNGLQLSLQLTQIKLAHLTGEARQTAIVEFANNNIENIDTALATANIDDSVWANSLLKDIQELSSLAKEDEQFNRNLTTFRDQIADLYIAKANETLQAERFDIADDYINAAERFAPGLNRLLDVRNTVASAREESERQSRIQANKSDYRTFTDADNVVEAEKILAQLKIDIAATDNYIAFEAPQMLAASYARLAQSKANTKDYSSAYSFVSRGLEIEPNNDLLNSLKNEYQAEANIIELNALFKTAFSFPVDVRLKINQIENGNPSRYAQFSKAAVKTFVDRIKQLRTSDQNAAASLTQSAAALFPADAILADLKNQFKLKPWAELATANAAILAGKFTQATALKQAATADFATHPDFIKFSQTLASKIKEAESVYELYLQDKTAADNDYEKLKITKSLLARAKSLWTDSPDFNAAEKELEQLIAAAKPATKPKIRTIEKSLDEITATPSTATDSETGATVAEAWKPIASESECTNRLASYGKRAKAICFDMVHQSARGPLMVVVPAGGSFDKPFAIAKYEISVSDWSKYCILSKSCKPIKAKARKNEPITGISLKQVQSYIAWLNERTGKTYRLPTKLEWEYAANAGGKQPKKDFNCRVSIAEKLIKGTGIVSVKSGRSNGWGLKNYIGNVQEWVIDGNKTTVRGGAFSDPHSKCDISLERSHNGDPDKITGFRLLRENVG